MSDSLFLDEPVFWFTGGATVLWLLLELMMPGVRRSIFSAAPKDVPKIAGRLRLLTSLQSVASIASFAGAIAIAAFFGARYWLQQVGEVPENLERLVSLRERASGVLESAGLASTSTWIGSLGLLAVIWVLASRSASRTRWSKAVGARRKAIEAAHSSMSADDLIEKLGGNESGPVRELYERAEQISQLNAAKFEAMRNLQVIEIGEQRRPASITDLEHLRAEVGAELANVVSRTDPASDLLEPEEHHEQSAEQSAEELQSLVNAIGETLEGLHERLTVELQDLDGFQRTVPMSEFLAHAAPSGEELRGALQALVIDYRMKDHVRTGASKPRKEPELIREWVGAVTTSQIAVKTSSAVGRASGTLALLVLFLGFFGFTASATGARLLETGKLIEFSIIADRNSASLDEALASVAADTEEAEAEPPELASNEATVQYVQQIFRSAIASDLTFGQRPANQIASARRTAFQLAAVEARQNVLGASTRAAAPSFDIGAPELAYDTTHASRPAAISAADEVFDDAIRRQTTQLQRNQTVWTRIRAEAARPARPSYAGDAFFRTAFPGGEVPNRHAVRLYANQAATDFSRDIASGQRVSSATVAAGPRPRADIPMTLQESRRFSEFRAELPERLTAQNQMYRAGAADPGSLNRVIARPSGAGARASARVTGAYAELFPSFVEAVGTTADAASSRPATAAARAAGTASRAGRGSAQVARSFARVRFSGRVGGVVIGRGPDEIISAPDIVGFGARMVSDTEITLTLRSRDGKDHDLGAYHPAVVHAALAYAADGRVVTSTLPQVGTQSEDEFAIPARQIIVHPAFADTAFACPAIQIDRFVDRFTSTDSYSARVQAIQTARMGVTGVGVALDIIGRTPARERRELVTTLLEQDAGEGLLSAAGIHAQSCGVGEDCFPLVAYTRLGYRFSGAEEVLACLAESNPSACAVQFAALSPQAAYAVDSGVRELPFSLDADLSFMKAPQGESNSLWPLDFMIQAVPQTLDGEDVDAGDDWEPWEFPSIADELRSEVAAGVSANSSAREVLSQMQAFTLLQRMFRLAFDGELGFDFPLEQLVKLQKATKPFVKVRRQERWNLNDDLMEALYTTNQEVTEVLASAVDFGDLTPTCRAAASTAIAEERAASWPESAAVWRFISEAEKHCGTQLADTGIIEFRDQFRRQELIDEAIRIAQPDAFDSDPSVCAPL